MSRFLRCAHIDRYGSLTGVDLGPLSPGLNVVYGPNEAGKSTIASFIGGVLFGWEEARGVRNTYRPAEGERSGSLEFEERDNGSVSVVSRARNAEGLQGDAGVVSDLDSATYRTMFWLTSDELRSLSNTSDVTARLLAAGSATGTSPSAAYVEVEQRIAALTAPAGEGSIGELAGELEAVRAQVAAAAEEVELLKQQDRERRELVEGRAVAAARLDEAADRLESLRLARVRMESIDAQVRSREAELATLRADYDQAVAEGASAANASCPQDLLAIDGPAERMLRDSVDELADEQAKAMRAVDAARENAAASTASYEALLEIGEDPGTLERSRTTRRFQVAVSILLPLAFVVAAVLVFAYGRQSRSLSFTVFGIGLMVFAGLLAAGALAVLLRPDKRAEVLEERRKNAQWVMVQDQKKLEAAERAKADVDDRVRVFLGDSGLGAAEGSIRQARALLDDARDERSRLSLENQRLSALAMRIASEDAALEALRDEREALLSENGLVSDATTAQLDALIHDAVAQRDALGSALDDMNERFGALDRRLGRALDDTTFDRAKARFHQLRCQMRERKHELVELLLAKRMLEKAIAAWESRSQPEVYAQASRLFEALTDGAWVRMNMTPEGHLTAVSPAGEVRDVRHLSLGTCQQLYLALRVAMLMQATAVGRDIPVIADDILVHFDATRRACAAQVLAELARTRQVIVFTCHRQTVAALRDADPTLECLQL